MKSLNSAEPATSFEKSMTASRASFASSDSTCQIARFTYGSFCLPACPSSQTWMSYMSSLSLNAERLSVMCLEKTACNGFAYRCLNCSASAFTKSLDRPA